jgi:hypothetical protein
VEAYPMNKGGGRLAPKHVSGGFSYRISRIRFNL